MAAPFLMRFNVILTPQRSKASPFPFIKRVMSPPRNAAVSLAFILCIRRGGGARQLRDADSFPIAPPAHPVADAFDAFVPPHFGARITNDNACHQQLIVHSKAHLLLRLILPT